MNIFQEHFFWTDTVMSNINEKTCAILFGGIGGATVGYMRSQVEYGGQLYRFKILCSIDYDPVACHNHDLVAGENTSIEMDLFRHWQYVAWHGKQPPSEWSEKTPWDIWVAFNYQVPFFLFTSPPCKGLTGLLPEEKSKSEKYQALNHLTVSGLELSLEACLQYGGDVPAIIQLENVPRITSRGKPLLQQIKKLLKRYGYAVSIRADHNLGEVGGLGQNRIRFLILARQESQIPNFIYYPEKKKLKNIGDILASLPAPNDNNKGGPLHRLPNLQWKTWLRLALIPAGGNWRNLNDIEYGNLLVSQDSNFESISDISLNIGGHGKTNLLRVQPFKEAAVCVTGAAGPHQGAACISDERINGYTNTFRIHHLNELCELNNIGNLHREGIHELPAAHERGTWVIIAQDGTWHRPLTTYELAVLQSFPMLLPDGRPFQLEGCTDAKAREYIGNAYPPLAAEQTGNVILLAAAEAEAGISFSLGFEPVWVAPIEEVEDLGVVTYH
ncbi:DNA cytosine methyltransferase [Paenibacillus sp. IITD108]|uniref:DNA cytosine methyltransferase n=1 Tax=Paenibacillus sp. IITD108 TaxID=3116649 RepID=UPI002F3FFDB0